MQWKFEDIVAFSRVVEAGSLTAAAERMNLAKSVVSKRISDLERALNTELFRRSTERLRLSDAGQQFYRRMTPLLNNLHNVVSEASARQDLPLSGQLRIMVPASFGAAYMRSTIADFARLNPSLKIMVDYDDRRIDPVEGGYDVGIRIGYLRDTSPNVRRLCECPRLICSSPAYARENGALKTVSDLEDHMTISYAHIPHHRYWEIDHDNEIEKPIPAPVKPRLVVSNGEAVRDLVLTGMGIAPMPIFMAAKHLRDGALVPVLRNVRLPKFAIEAVHYPIVPLSRQAQRFIEHLERFFAPPHPWAKDLEDIHAMQH